MKEAPTKAHCLSRSLEVVRKKNTHSSPFCKILDLVSKLKRKTFLYYFLEREMFVDLEVGILCQFLFAWGKEYDAKKRKKMQITGM